ncbi:AMP-binding protein [Kiloniella litopenaei]|uniref:AMP-binding protein n=1 Tax=Kiloniella litopenaei TaxID=1549748 RepID=UPI003BA9E5AC
MKCLKDSFEKHQNSKAIVDPRDGRSLSYGDIAVLQQELLGLFPTPKKNLVFFQPTNSILSAATILALLASENTLCLLNPELEGSSYKRYVEDFSPNLLLQVNDNSGSQPLSANSFRIIANEQGLAHKLPANLRLLLPTSGTTGSAKLVMLSDENLSTNSDSVIEAMNITTASIAYAHLPLFYSYGLSILLSHALAGAKSVVTSTTLMERNFWNNLREQNCTLFPGVPFHFEMLLKFGLARLKIPSVTSFSVAGGPLDTALQERFAKQLHSDHKFYIMYGQTEASPRISTFDLMKYPEKIGSVGNSLSCNQLSIDKDTSEIIAEGTNVTMGYATDFKELASCSRATPPLRTGDIGYLDTDGFLYITGRMKRIAKRFGLRINLDDMERSLSRIGKCAVIEIHDTIHIFFTRPTLEADLLAHYDELYNIPGDRPLMHCVEALPRLASGKIDYQNLRELI